MNFRCPHCGYDGTTPAAYGPEPFTYFELVPRWQKVSVRDGRLHVRFEESVADDGEPFLRCNECERDITEVPRLVFEGKEAAIPKVCRP
jgi:hypothetical protein